MLSVVFGLEEGMRALYERLGGAVSDPDASALFRELAALEINHKQAVYALYRARGGEIDSIEAMEAQAARDVMEGGLDPNEMFEAIQPNVRSVTDVLTYAMMLETQALDLYLRFSQRSEDESTTAVLLELADQEKGHLRALGELMDQRTGGA